MRTLPIACDSSAFGSSEAFAAHLTEGRRLLSLATEHRELDEGWAMHLPGDDGTVLATAHWILGERRRCPLLTFSLECQPAGELWMRITGSEGVRDRAAKERRAEEVVERKHLGRDGVLPNSWRKREERRRYHAGPCRPARP